MPELTFDWPGPLAGFFVGRGSQVTVLLHGFLGSGKNLRTLAVRWAERQPERTIVVLDLPGHGESPPLSMDVDTSAMARAVLRTTNNLARQLGHDGKPYELVGHSLGGRVALAALAGDPVGLSGLSLLDIAPGPIDPRLSESRQVLDVILRAPPSAPDRRSIRHFLVSQGLVPALADWVLMNLKLDDSRYVWRIDRAALSSFHDRFARLDLWPLVEATTLPLWVIRGGKSPYVTEQDVQRFAAAGRTVTTLPQAGHFLHVDALEQLLDWLCRAS